MISSFSVWFFRWKKRKKRNNLFFVI